MRSAEGAHLQWRLYQPLPYLVTLLPVVLNSCAMIWAALCLSSRLPSLRKELSYSVCWLSLIPCCQDESSSGSVMLSPPKRSSGKSKRLSFSCCQQEIASLTKLCGRISCVGLQVFACNRLLLFNPGWH